VFIGLGLIGILLTTLMIYLRKTTLLHSKLERAETEIVCRASLHTRLQQVFSHLALDEQPVLYTKQIEEEELPVLHFFFHNEMDPEKAFSGVVKGSLFVEDGQFILEVSSLSVDLPIKSRRELLYSNMQSVQWNFFDWAENTKTQIWEKKKTSLPNAIQIVFKKNDEVFSFPFFLNPTRSE